ncbi:hypothetical protein [Halalkalicoccus ordinarius]|uniref:hypothetical protein n=1 Tax=Halalkalicoccus ordinarius TaxID=3116651 RepID=UPI00300EEA0A
MSDDGPMDRAGPDERAWREIVDRTVRSDDDCCELVDGLRASRSEFDENADADAAGVSRAQTAMAALIVLAIPVILYSDLVTPNGAINYAGMGTGLVLMVAAGLAHF